MAETGGRCLAAMPWCGMDSRSGNARTSSTSRPRGVALTIAGSDPSGGAGIQADLKTFMAHGVYGAAAITALTAQNTLGVQGVHASPPAFVAAQVRLVLDDLPVAAVKTGMLYDAGTVAAVAETLALRPTPPTLVLDPVLLAKSGHALLLDDAVDAVRTQLLPLATVVTPNRPEAEVLTGVAVVDDERAVDAGRRLLELGARAALIKGGHADDDVVHDILVTPEGHRVFTSPRHRTRHTHGTGCTLAAAIAASLASDLALVDAVARSVAWVNAAIASAPGLGGGHGPLNHFAPLPIDTVGVDHALWTST